MKEGMKFLTNHYQLREFTLTRMLQLVNQNKTAKLNGTVFFGDSITELCDLQQYYPEIENKYNTGIAGITSKMLLNFIDEGVVKYQPKQVVIMIGTNDLGDTVMESPRDIALNVKEMVEIIHYNLPECQIHLLSPIPCIEKVHGYQAMHQGLRSHDILQMIMQEYKRMIPYDYVHFIDIYQSLYQDNILREDVFIDGLHINEDGYALLTEAIFNQL